MLAECVPTNINKMAQEAELAYRRLMDVNSNIPPTDYGQGVYDDLCVHNRYHKRRRVAPDEYEAEIARGLAFFKEDKLFLEEMRRRSADTVNPVEKLAELRRAMEHTRHDHIGGNITSTKNLKEAQMHSDYEHYDIILANLQSQVTQTIAEQHDKDALR